MIGSYAQLNTDVWPFLAGTQFKIENEDDGMYSLNDFFRGPTSDGQIVTCKWKECDYISSREYKGITKNDPFEMHYPEKPDWELDPQ